MIDALRKALLTALSPSGKFGRLLILTFHQVPREPDQISPDVPHASVFADQMCWLKTYCNVLPLAEAVECLRDGRLPARAASITFDDGYADNYDVAAPILERFGLPATFFVTAGAVDEGIMWNDLVIEGIKRADGLLNLSEFGFGTPELSSIEPRRSAVKSVIAKLKYEELDTRWAIANSIFARATSDRAPRLMMTMDQVASLSSRGFDIGSHTINHPILKEMPTHNARQEIEQSRDWVAGVTGKKPKAFAYPNGKPGIDFDKSHEQMARDAGYLFAVSTRWGSATKSDSMFALPRFTPWERNRSAFCTRLAKTNAKTLLSRQID